MKSYNSLHCYVISYTLSVEHVWYIASIYGNVKSSDVYFSNVKHIEIKLALYGSYDVMKILKIFKNLKTLMIYFNQSAYDYKNIEGLILITDLENQN